MDRHHYETALLLASGAVLGQLVIILAEIAFSVWSFIPMIGLTLLLGAVSLRAISRNKGLITAGVNSRLITGLWIFLVWDLLRRRILWLPDVLKCGMLLRKWEE